MNYTDDDLDDLEYGKLNYDEDQDLITRYNYPLYIKRSIQELQGLAAAIIYDSTVDDNEIRLLIEWTKKHNDITGEFPLNRLMPIFKKIIQQGHSTTELQKDIFKILSSFAADPTSSPVVDKIFNSRCQIIFRDKSFLFTGKLFFSERAKAQNKVTSLGGIAPKGGVTRGLDYLVVGDLGNVNWKYSRFGSKIEQAIALRNQNGTPYIIREKHFVEAVLEQSQNL